MGFFKRLKKRENRMMLLRLWAVFKIVFHTTLVVTDIISDFVYVIKVDFYNQSLKGFCILFIIVIPLFIYSVTLATIIRKIYIKKRCDIKLCNICLDI